MVCFFVDIHKILFKRQHKEYTMDMKTIRVIIILIFIAVALSFFVRQKPSDITELFPLDSYLNDPVDLCFSEIHSREDTLKDEYALRMRIQDGNVEGELQFIPAEKDKKIGNFTGSIVSSETNNTTQNIVGLWKTQAEGMESTEELRIQFTTTLARVGTGEMKENKDGVYYYADPTNISYALKLEAVNCHDVDERHAVEQYVRDNISTLAPNSPVLGGTWYVYSISVDPSKNTGTVIYEDGHIQSHATFDYTVEESSTTVSTLKLHLIE